MVGRLLDRDRRGVALTEAGRVMLREAEAALDAVTAVARRTRRAGDPKRPLVLATKAGASHELLQRLLDALAREPGAVPVDILLCEVGEQAGLLRPLADAVLGLALSAAAGWWTAREVPVSVNLSAADVTDLDLPGKVAAALARHDLPPRALTLELVEDTLMADPERGQRVLGELRRLGVRTSIDDYGTGYSSLAYLRRLPADELKLDRSLTHDVGMDPRAAVIVKHTVALAHDLGLSVVAEGVEDDATGLVLRELGCDIAQGWAIARPMPVVDFLDWLQRPARPMGVAATAPH